MFGFAVNETRTLMPMPIDLSHKLTKKLTGVRKKGVLPWLRPDGKTQVTVRYADGIPVGIERVLISTQHAEGIDGQEQIRPDLWENVILPVLTLHSAELIRGTAQALLASPKPCAVIWSGNCTDDDSLTHAELVRMGLPVFRDIAPAMQVIDAAARYAELAQAARPVVAPVPPVQGGIAAVGVSVICAGVFPGLRKARSLDARTEDERTDV